MVGAPVVGSFVVGLRVGSFVVYVELIERAEEEVAVSILQLVIYKTHNITPHRRDKLTGDTVGSAVTG